MRGPSHVVSTRGTESVSFRWWRSAFDVVEVDIAVIVTRKTGPAGGCAVGTFGQHLLAEYHGCEADILDDQDRIRALIRRAAEAAGANVVAEVYQPFAPHGVSGVAVIEESHLSIHTWPERGYAAVDFYTCGDCVAERGHAVLLAGLDAQRAELMMVHRGRRGPGGSLHVDSHRQENRASEQLPLVGEG